MSWGFFVVWGFLVGWVFFLKFPAASIPQLRGNRLAALLATSWLLMPQFY